MIALQVTTDDLMNIRFAYTPLMELIASYRVLVNPEFHHAPHLPWHKEASNSLYDVDMPYMQAVLGYKSYIPDFLTPTPSKTNLNIEADFQIVLDTSADQIRRNITKLNEIIGESDERHHFITEPHIATQLLIDEMRIYWNRTLAHHWEQIQSVLDNDIRYRAQRLTLGGIARLFDEIHPHLHYENQELMILRGQEKFCIYKPEDYVLHGHGLQLVPVLFGFSSLCWQPNENAPFMLEYGARGAGLWYAPEPVPSMEALEMTLGVGKARILQSLITTQSTSELARNLELTAGAVSQQLGKLNQAGLVESHRQGKRVYYRLSQRGSELINLFSA